MKIILQYKGQVNKLTWIICSLTALRASRFTSRILAYSLTNGGKCYFQIIDSTVLDQLVFFFQDPFLFDDDFAIFDSVLEAQA